MQLPLDSQSIQCQLLCKSMHLSLSDSSHRHSVAAALVKPALPVCAEYASLQVRLSDINPLHDWHLSANCEIDVPALPANAIEDTVLPHIVAELQQLGSKLAPPCMSPTCTSTNSVPAELASRDDMRQCQKGWPGLSDGHWTQDQADCLQVRGAWQVKGAKDLERAACHALMHIKPPHASLPIVTMPVIQCTIHRSSRLPAGEGGGGPGAPPPAPAALL